MKLYSKGYTIKQRFTGVLVVALVPAVLVSIGFTEVVWKVTELLKLWQIGGAVVHREGLFIDWYGRLLESMKKKGG